LQAIAVCGDGRVGLAWRVVVDQDSFPRAASCPPFVAELAAGFGVKARGGTGCRGPQQGFHGRQRR